MVLHVRVVSGSGGGPDKTILRSSSYAARSDLRMAAAYIHPRRDPGIDVIRDHAAAFDCPLWAIPESGPLDPRTIAALRRLCREQGVRVWHGHDYKSNVLGLILRRFLPLKLITTVHGWTNETVRTRLYTRIDKWCLSRYEQVIAVSRRLHEDCISAGVRPERLSYIPNAIDPTAYGRRRSRSYVRRRLGLNPNQLALGVVGRLSVEKGVDRAIRLLAKLRRNWPSIHLHLIGDGPQRQALHELARKLEVSGNVTFWGWQSRLARFYEMMDMLLLTSHTEGLPNAVLEAMAMHTPVAATDVGDLSELLDHGRCGLILTDDDTAWPRQLAPLLTNVTLRTELADAARTRIERHFSFDRRMAKVISVYRRILPDIAQPGPVRHAA